MRVTTVRVPRSRPASATNAGSSPNDTQLTHEMWAVSARCTTWGSRPTAKRLSAVSRQACSLPARRAHTAITTRHAVTTTNEQKNMKICSGWSATGSGQGNSRKAKARLRNPV